MGKYLDKLAVIGSAPLSAWSEAEWEAVFGKNEDLFFAQLGQWLQAKNGFYAFESALHVFSTVELRYHNDPANWRSDYGALADGCFFFAEDLFGGPFVYQNGLIASFDPETAQTDPVARDLEGWAEAILKDYNFLTGYPLAHEWQKIHGALPMGKRLAPKMPFVTGGKFELSNLYLADHDELMRFRGMLAQKIHSLPDGAQIKFNIVD